LKVENEKQETFIGRSPFIILSPHAFYH